MAEELDWWSPQARSPLMPGKVSRLHLLVEGQTEETVAENLLRPHLEMRGWLVTISILTTKRPASGGKFRGGVSGWTKVARDVNLLLRSNFAVVTTLIDY